MSFDKSKLYLTSGTTGDAPRHWTYYSADDAIADINTSGYFNDVASTLKAYDVLFIRDSANVMTIAYVTSNDGSVVDISDGLTITATDTD